jgi:hypothetical protein
MASRKEQKETLRQQRLEEEAKTAGEQRRKQATGYALAGLLGVAVIAGIVIVIVAGGGGGSTNSPANAHIVDIAGATTTSGAKPDARKGKRSTPGSLVAVLPAAAKAAGCELKNPPDAGNQHVPASTAVHYKTKPPTSGNHDPVPLADGAYLTTPPARHFVHTMEHGRVEIEYSPSLSVADQLKLKGVFDEDFTDMLMFPNADMPYQVAAAAWDHYLGCKTYNDKVLDAIRAFRNTYRGNGPEPTSAQPG